MLYVYNECFFKFSGYFRDTVTSNSLYCSEGSLCWNVSWSYHLKAKRNCPSIIHSNSIAPCSKAVFSKNSYFKRKLLFSVSQKQLNFTLEAAIGFVETFRNIKYSCVWFSKIQDIKGINWNCFSVNIFNIYYYSLKYGYSDKVKRYQREDILGKLLFSSCS